MYTWDTFASIVGPAACEETTNRSDCFYPQRFPFRPTTALVANTGAWGGDFSAEVLSGIREALPPLPMRVIWRTTGPAQGMKEPNVGRHQSERAVFGDDPRGIWEQLDVFEMTRKEIIGRAYWDGLHFLPFVFEEINVWMLNMLCDEQWKWQSTQSQGK